MSDLAAEPPFYLSFVRRLFPAWIASASARHN